MHFAKYVIVLLLLKVVYVFKKNVIVSFSQKGYSVMEMIFQNFIRQSSFKCV